MVILRTRNKITDFFMILAWASPFKALKCLENKGLVSQGLKKVLNILGGTGMIASSSTFRPDPGRVIRDLLIC